MALFYIIPSSDEDEMKQGFVRRQLRDKSNPLSLPNKSFLKRFRLNKAAFRDILKELNFAGHMSTSIPPVLQLAATLSLLGSGSYQQQVGNDFLIGMSQSTVSTIIGNVVTEMETNICPHWIKFDPLHEQDCKKWFMEKYKLPGVIDCVDGTHIVLQKPPENEHMFFNRKAKHSLNAMIICNHDYKINAINCKFGGAAHDSFVWAQSDERTLLEEEYGNNKERHNFWLLGDSGYPIEPWCITPYRKPTDGSSKAKFNETHSKARSLVERCIGIYKGRWRILQYGRRGRYSPEKMCQFANVCTALHNICIRYKINFDVIPTVYGEESHALIHENTELNYKKIGEKIRNDIRISIIN